MLVTQTNLYANQYCTQHSLLPCYSRARPWKDETIEEIWKFAALHLLTRIIRKPEISKYWSTDPLLVTPIFNNIMSRNRYQSVLEFPFTLMIIPSMMLLTLTGTVFSRSDHWLNTCSKDLKRCIFQVVKFRLMKNWCSGKVDSYLNSTSLARDVSLA